MAGALVAGALALAPTVALAQAAPTTNTPATDAIGPRELQNFSLNGTVTRPADQAPAPATRRTPAPRPSRSEAQTNAPPASAPAAAPPTSSVAAAALEQPNRSAVAANAAPAPQRMREPLRQSAPAASVTVALPHLDSTAGQSSADAGSATPSATPAAAPEPEAAGTLAPEHKLSLLPWLLAAMALGAGGAFLFWRNRSRPAFAGGPQIDAFVAPEPAPAPRPAPAPAPAPPKAPSMPGVVSARLRPWIDIGFNPLRCVLDEERVTIDFEIELFNSGTAPAQAVLVEASLFNAGPAQDQEIGAFFANPVGEGERIAVIPPLKRITLKTQVACERERLQSYELGGKQVFVPLIGFNALYRWSGGEGQTSLSFLLGRDTKGEKLAPFRLDLGPRLFRGVAAHLLPTRKRT
ncbi:MAG TPA: hypothetical protein VIV07_08125 [Sphingomicrobium sp.]